MILDFIKKLEKPTLKAIHICNSHKPKRNQKLQKSMSLPTLTDREEEEEVRVVTWAKIKWAESAKRNLISFWYFCGGGQESTF